MTTSLDLAARFSGVVAAQQEILAAVTDVDKVLGVIVAKTPEITGGSGAVVELVEGDELVYRAASGSAAKHIGLRLPVDRSLSGHTIRERKITQCDDVELEPRADIAACRAIGIRSMIIAPLLDGESAIGVLKTFSPLPDAFNDLDAYVVQLLAGICSSAVLRAQEFKERTISEARYRLLFERNVAGVFRSTTDGRMLDCNEAFAGYLGYDSREELLSRKAWDFYEARSDRETLLHSLDRSNAMTNVRLKLKRKDGTVMTGLVNATILADDRTQILGTLVTAPEQ